MTSEDLSKKITKLLVDKKARDISLYDCRGKSDIADFFIVATATSTPHMRALLNEMRTTFKNTIKLQLSGTADSGWVAADCYDVVVHIFKPELRSYYALDDLFKKTSN